MDIPELVRNHSFFSRLDQSQLHVTRLGGWSNTTFKLDFGHTVFVVRENRDNRFLDIDRKTEKEGSLLAEKIGIGPAILYAEDRFHIMPFIPNRGVLTPQDCMHPEMLQSTVHALKSLHQSKIRFSRSLNPFKRICKVYKKISKIKILPLPKEVPILLKEWEPLFSEKTLEKTNKVCCHNDTTPYNFLKTEKGIQIIDWEHAALNDPAWDLAYLSAEAQLSQEMDSNLLSYYQENLDPSFFYRFSLYKPLVHLWIVVWIYTQIYSSNQALSIKEFIKTAQERLFLCMNTSTKIKPLC